MKHDHIKPAATVTATEFKAKCLDLLDQVQSGRIAKLTVTKRGKPVAVVSAPPITAAEVEAMFGAMADQTHIPEGVDIVGPIFEGEILAEQGILHT